MTETGLPLNIYRSPQRLMVATTAPGLEPQNIRIELEGQKLSIQGAVRGLGQERKHGYLREWMLDPTSALSTCLNQWMRAAPTRPTITACWS